MPIVKSQMQQAKGASDVPEIPWRITHAPDCPNLDGPELDIQCPICECATEKQLQEFLVTCRNARVLTPSKGVAKKPVDAMPRASNPTPRPATPQAPQARPMGSTPAPGKLKV